MEFVVRVSREPQRAVAHDASAEAPCTSAAAATGAQAPPLDHRASSHTAVASTWRSAKMALCTRNSGQIMGLSKLRFLGSGSRSDKAGSAAWASTSTTSNVTVGNCQKSGISRGWG